MRNHMGEEVCPITGIPLSRKADFSGITTMGATLAPRSEQPIDPMVDYEGYREQLMKTPQHAPCPTISQGLYSQEIGRVKRPTGKPPILDKGYAGEGYRLDLLYENIDNTTIENVPGNRIGRTLFNEGIELNSAGMDILTKTGRLRIGGALTVVLTKQKQEHPRGKWLNGKWIDTDSDDLSQGLSIPTSVVKEDSAIINAAELAKIEELRKLNETKLNRREMFFLVNGAYGKTGTQHDPEPYVHDEILRRYAQYRLGSEKREPKLLCELCVEFSNGEPGLRAEIRTNDCLISTLALHNIKINWTQYTRLMYNKAIKLDGMDVSIKPIKGD